MHIIRGQEGKLDILAPEKELSIAKEGTNSDPFKKLGLFIEPHITKIKVASFSLVILIQRNKSASHGWNSKLNIYSRMAL